MRLLHVHRMLSRHMDETFSMSPEATDDTDLTWRPKASLQQTHANANTESIDNLRHPSSGLAHFSRVARWLRTPQNRAFPESGKAGSSKRLLTPLQLWGFDRSLANRPTRLDRP